MFFNWLLSFEEGGSFEIGSPRSRVKEFSTYTDSEWSWKFANFHRRHMCIIPRMVKQKQLETASIQR